MRAVACAVLSASAVTAKSMRSPPSQLSPAYGASVSQRVLRLCRLAVDKTRRSRFWFSTKKLKSSLSIFRFLGERNAVRVPLHLPDELVTVVFSLREQMLKFLLCLCDQFVA